MFVSELNVYIHRRGESYLYTLWKIGEQCRSGLLFPIDVLFCFGFFLCSLVHAKNMFNILTSALLWKMTCLCFGFSCVFLALHFVPCALFSWDVKSFSFVSCRPNCPESRTVLCSTWISYFFCSASKNPQSLWWGIWSYLIVKYLLFGREGQ